MVAGISHDLRTPLTAVRGTIKGLMDGIASSPEQQKLFWRRHIEEQETWMHFYRDFSIFPRWKQEICRCIWKR